MKKTLYIKILDYFHDILIGSKFENHVYTVGGCNRDFLMGNDPHDIDICVDLIEGGIKLAEFLYNKGVLLHEPVYYPTYGTSAFTLKEFPDITIEAVMTRKERYTDKNSRNPETVFGTLEEDASRRDLTINSIYYNLSTKEYIDPNEGKTDITLKRLDTPQDPDIIFTDDPLRILRVIRFVLRFNDFSVNSVLRNKIIINRHRLNIITQERKTDELSKMLSCCKLSNFFTEMKYFKVMPYLMPDICHVFENYDNVLKTTSIHFKNADQIIKDYEITYKLAIILLVAHVEIHTRHYYEIQDMHLKRYSDMLKEMKFSNHTANTVIHYMQLIFLFMSHINYIVDNMNTEYHFRTMEYYAQSPEVFQKIFQCVVFIAPFDLCDDVHTSYYHYVTNTKLTNTTSGYDLKLPINGNDIIKFLNIQPGKEIKALLKEALNIYLRDPKIDITELLQQLKEIYDRKHQEFKSSEI